MAYVFHALQLRSCACCAASNDEGSFWFAALGSTWCFAVGELKLESPDTGLTLLIGASDSCSMHGRLVIVHIQSYNHGQAPQRGSSTYSWLKQSLDLCKLNSSVAPLD